MTGASRPGTGSVASSRHDSPTRQSMRAFFQVVVDALGRGEP
jgi:hypothetical protein